jgi:phosphate transport system substrate-binding protein
MNMKMKLRKSAALALGLTLAVTSMVTGCSEGGASGGETVVMSGSTSVLPFAEVLAAAYEKDFGGSPVDVQGGGSGQGIIAARTGVADVGMSSRGLRGDELQLDFVTIARDGLALIVHPDNPITGLTATQIRSIYTGDVTRWIQFCEQYEYDEEKDKETTCRTCDICKFTGGIHAVTREEGSGTRGAFEEMVMQYNVPVSRNLAPRPDCDDCGSSACEEHSGSVTVLEPKVDRIHGKTIVLNTNGAIRQFVAGNPNAIGYISLGTVVICGLQQVKQLSIDGIAPFDRAFDESGSPLFDTTCRRANCCPLYVFNPSYRLSRPFIFIIGENPSPETIAFIEFTLSEAGQDILEKYGLIKRSERDAQGDTFIVGGAV